MRTRKQEIGSCNMVGKRIEERRQEINMKQKDLLAKLQMQGIEINASGLSKLEGQIRKVSDFELVALANVLEVTVPWLLGLEE